MKHSVFLLRSFTLLVIIASVWCYQTAAVQRSEVTAQVRAEAFEIRKQREAEASKAQPGKYKDGTYEGEAEGFGGPIRVRVTVSAGKIREIDVYDHAKEDDTYFGMALSVTEQMTEANDTKADIVSGATFSSNGIINAVTKALEKAVRT